MTPELTIRYRGPLSSCNYDCGYCPFAKRKDSRATLAEDRHDLERFSAWLAQRRSPISVLFTPWGEALVRQYYRDALIQLSHLDHVNTVAIQTNLSRMPDWAIDANPKRLALWVTYHPSETALAPFLKRLSKLDALGISYSVGCVAQRDQFTAIAALRAALPTSVYLWINAEESLQGRYSLEEIEQLVAIDPLFELNNRSYETIGVPCAAGQTSITVRGDGSMWRCHFIEEHIGNIYDDDFESALVARPCPNQSCNCHIGYGQMPIMDFSGLYGSGLHERRATAPTRAQALTRLAAFDAIRKPALL